MNTRDADIALGFGGRLRQLREGIGLSVPKFASKVGFDRSYVYKLEHGLSDNPSLKFIEAVVNLFGVDRQWLLGGVGDGSVLQIRTTPGRCGLDGYIRMRLECLLDLVETYETAELEAVRERMKQLAASDQRCGKLFSEVANIVAHVELRRMKDERASGHTPKPDSGAK